MGADPGHGTALRSRGPRAIVRDRPGAILAPMPGFVVGLDEVPLPSLRRVRQSFPSPTVADPAAAVAAELERPAIARRLRRGSRAALAVGSRGIHALAPMVAALVAGLRERGVEPVVVPSMGSHGSATPEGQRAVLARLGVDESSVGAPVISDLATRVVGWLRWDEASGAYQPAAESADGLPVHVARDALDADLVIPVARIKPHTGFRGEVESGICKMLAIGLGKHEGCSRLHREGYPRFPALLPAAARMVLGTGRIAFALAVVENADERTAHVEAVDGDDILAREPALLQQARSLMPRLLPREIDVLVVERFGKDISGVGMDPNVTGRAELGVPAGFDGPRIRRIVVLGLSAAAGGNATGIGMADLITEELFAGIDRVATATNVLTSGSLAGGRIPVAVPGADRAIRAALACVPGVKPQDARVVRIRDTLRLSEIAVSESLLPVVRADPAMQDLGPFDGTWGG